MKEKTYKVIFFIIVIILIIFAIYYIIKNKGTLANNVKTKKINNQIINEVVIGITDFDTVNPILSENQDIQYISKLIYDPLINIDEKFNLKIGLAIEWSKLDDRTYLMVLDENKNWQNGEKFTAKDVEYTINYIKNQKSIYNDNVENIDKIEIINDYTIKIYLIEPEEDFEYMLCFPIICEEKNIGTGNFYMYSENEKEITLKSKTNDKEIEIKIYDDVSDLYNSFSREEIDIITTTNINFSDYIGIIGYNKKIICNRNFDYLKFNIDEPEVIQAILYAVNKNEIIYKIYNNLYCQAEFPLQYGSYLYNGDINYEYNLSKAKKILKEAGWEYDGNNWRKNRKNLKLQITTNEDRIKVAEIIKANLEELGINVNIRELDNSYYKNNMEEINYEILLTGNIVSIKPSIQEYLDFTIESKPTKQETYKEIFNNYIKNPKFMGLYFDSIILLYSNNLKGNFSGNWYNIFYNIDTWYKEI